MYWKIENWKVVEFYRELPKVIWNTSLWKNITNEELKEFWILPVIWNSPVLEEWQTYWAKSYNILEDKIKEDKEVINKTLDDYKAKKIKTLSDKCKSDILAEYSEIDQLNNIREFARLQDKYNATWEINKEKVAELRAIDKWIEDRRAEYHIQKEAIQSFTTYQEVKDYVDSLLPNEEI